jgi:hypothetical protein
MTMRCALVALLLAVTGFAPDRPLCAGELRGAESLRAAIEDLIATFGDRYPAGPAYLKRLEQLVATPAALRAAALQEQLDQLARESLLANPLLTAQPLLFVVRHQYKRDHHNTETMFQTGEINTGSFQGPGAIKALDLAHGGTVRTLLEVPDGVARDPDVSFDGRKVLFSMRRHRSDDYHLYEIGADGSGLVQLTFGAGVSDIDPIYLPNGQICFTSTREPKYCMCNRHIMGNLYTMDADGANLQQIGHSTLHEGHASLMPDGRILYDRWEYVDRDFGDAQGVWTVNPDGTNHAVYFKNNTNSPGAALDPRIIPGTQQLICTFSSCHDRPWGAIAIVDRRRGTDMREPVLRTWPAEAINLVGRGNYDAFTRVSPKYEDPYPLSDKYFLCARMTGRSKDPEEMGIYLLDLFGNEVLVYSEPPGCFDPMPLGPRVRAPAVPPRVDWTREEGYFYVADVYRGTGMERIPRGTVKRLRVVESPEKRFFTGPGWDGGTGQQAPGMAWNDFNNKQIWGSVPVEADGSAYFAVPADRFVYFQILDERGMMVQSMRSGTIVRPGETAGCVGCHDGRREAIPSGPQPLAVRRAASPIEPWHSAPRTFSYAAEVQPALDKHCVGCHDYGKPAGKKLNLAGDRGLIFNTSYVELRSKNWVRVVGAGPFQVQMPKTWGAHASRLAKYLWEGHGDTEIDRQIKLDPESIDRLITWIDINAPYYPEYAGAFPDHLYGRCPLDARQLDRLGKLTGLKLQDHRHLIAVSFTRPELSPCLEALAAARGPAYQEALEIVRAGRKTLETSPNDETPGFRLVGPADVLREEKYRSRRQIESQMRGAIRAGRKLYDRQGSAER